jgi:hypothetical protein
MIPIKEQIAEVARELAIRRAVYPKWVASGKLKQAACDQQITRMEAALETLKCVESTLLGVGIAEIIEHPFGSNWEQEPNTGVKARE